MDILSIINIWTPFTVDESSLPLDPVGIDMALNARRTEYRLTNKPLHYRLNGRRTDYAATEE